MYVYFLGCIDVAEAVICQTIYILIKTTIKEGLEAMTATSFIISIEIILQYLEHNLHQILLKHKINTIISGVQSTG
jgi:hypothetical protein